MFVFYRLLKNHWKLNNRKLKKNSQQTFSHFRKLWKALKALMNGFVTSLTIFQTCNFFHIFIIIRWAKHNILPWMNGFFSLSSAEICTFSLSFIYLLVIYAGCIINDILTAWMKIHPIKVSSFIRCQLTTAVARIEDLFYAWRSVSEFVWLCSNKFSI